VNQWMKASQERTTSSNLTDMGWVAVQIYTTYVQKTLRPVDIACREAMVKACGVTVAKPQGHSWTPTLSSGSR
jgi:fructose-1,6-bisphosphatase/inositol monophosphatase family enzyme